MKYKSETKAKKRKKTKKNVHTNGYQMLIPKEMME